MLPTTTLPVVLAVDNTSTLGIGQWPRLSYQPRRVCPEPNIGVARGAARQGDTQATLSDAFEGTVHLHWTAAALTTPPLTWRTTFLACTLPWCIPFLPPGCAVHITTDELHGYLHIPTGSCELVYDARYVFTAGRLYTSPVLRVRTTLTTEGGVAIDASGRGRLVGTATVAETGGWLCDTMLSLPTTCTTCLDVHFELLTSN